jgi:hypothetical protein
MRHASAALALVLSACGSEVPENGTPGKATQPDSALIIAVEDSVLDALVPGRSAVTRFGDTLVHIGGGMIGEEYAASEYRKNGAPYVRMQRLLGNRPDGWPIWSTRSRILLPAMDSTQELLMSGQCGTARKSDSKIIAIAAGKTDSIYREIRHAWRFDSASQTLRARDTVGLTCLNLGES